MSPSPPTSRDPSTGLTQQERLLLTLIPEAPAPPALTGDVVHASGFSASACYRSLHQLVAWRAVTAQTVRLPRILTSHNAPRHAKAYTRTARGTALLEQAPTHTPRRGPPAKSRPPARETSLLDLKNTGPAATTFRTAMTACGLDDMDALHALSPARRRQFEQVWTQVMYDRCAEAGTPIQTANSPREHATPSPSKKGDPLFD